MTRGFRPYFENERYVNIDTVIGVLHQQREAFKSFVCDVSHVLSEQDKEGKRVLFEGAQGTLLDIDHGTYPHVTSSNTTLGGVYTGTGICLPLESRLGILKAYTTRVGNGVFPTELTDEIGKRLQERGAEYGATTGRPRRCGWLDLVIGKYAVRVNGLNEIALTKLDVLDIFDEIQVCVAYDMGQFGTNVFPTSERTLGQAKPKYETLPGWKKDTTGAREFSELPENAQNFVKFVENHLGTHVKYISIGEKRDQVITRWR